MQSIQKPKQELKYPSFSIVIEWENFLQTDEKWHAQIMLQRLCEDILHISKRISKAEILIVYDPEEIEIQKIEEFTKKELSPILQIINLKFIPAQKLDYYEMKNLGAKNSSGDLILFTDSDTIPDKGWLIEMLDSFEQNEVNVIAGNTYIALNNILERILALIWFVPLLDSAQIYKKPAFHANNVAFRRRIFEAHHFPNLNQFHGHCDELVSELIRNNIEIYRQPKCQVSHPMPLTIHQFITWSLSQGLDFLGKRCALKVKAGSKYDSYERGSIKQIISITRKRLRYVGLSPTVFLGACVVLPAYWTIMSFGIVWSVVHPNYYNFIRRKKWSMWT